jgi:hypothetical protein
MSGSTALAFIRQVQKTLDYSYGLVIIRGGISGINKIRKHH